jgi:hypothetical protein
VRPAARLGASCAPEEHVVKQGLGIFCTRASLLAASLALCLAHGTAEAQDDRSGYYYPPITSEEVFVRDILPTPPADRTVRTNFMTEVTKAQLAAPENPRFAIFAKGDDAEHMIIVALDDEIFRTLYRARALLAQLTANARGTKFFVDSNLQFTATWFDLAKMLGFADIVISDGASWSHRITLE